MRELSFFKARPRLALCGEGHWPRDHLICNSIKAKKHSAPLVSR